MGPGRTDRAVDQSPMATNPLWQQSGIFIFQGHSHPIAFRLVKIFGECQGHARAVVLEGRIDDGTLV